MSASKAQIKATAKYKAKTYSRIPLDVPKEHHEYLKGVAKSQGLSLNGFIKQAIDEKCERLNGDNLPPEVVQNLIKWLKDNGHSAQETVDCLKSLNCQSS